MALLLDPVQRMLLRCVLDDALEGRLAPLLDCPACEYWMEHGPCPDHRDGRRTWARYLGLSARLTAPSARPWPLTARQAQLAAQAIPEALGRRGSAVGVDPALTAAYLALAAQLDPAKPR